MWGSRVLQQKKEKKNWGLRENSVFNNINIIQKNLVLYPIKLIPYEILRKLCNCNTNSLQASTRKSRPPQVST